MKTRQFLATVVAVMLALVAGMSGSASAVHTTTPRHVAGSNAPGPDDPCNENGGMTGVEVKCNQSQQGIVEKVREQQSGTSLYEYRVDPCSGLQQCAGGARVCPPEVNGQKWATVERRLRSGGPWTFYAYTCLSGNEATMLGVVTITWVTEKFEALSWDSAVLKSQPSGGRTLVRFNTNFYTTVKPAQEQTVQFDIGPAVTVRAMPAHYRWNWGDGESATSDTPGSEYVAAGRKVIVGHPYLETGDFLPSVDITYRGCYYLDGDSDNCEPIPDLHTVPGEPMDLEVITAEPRLVQ